MPQLLWGSKHFAYLAAMKYCLIALGGARAL